MLGWWQIEQVCTRGLAKGILVCSSVICTYRSPLHRHHITSFSVFTSQLFGHRSFLRVLGSNILDKPLSHWIVVSALVVICITVFGTFVISVKRNQTNCVRVGLNIYRRIIMLIWWLVGSGHQLGLGYLWAADLASASAVPINAEAKSAAQSAWSFEKKI